jgi:hypothetical protein
VIWAFTNLKLKTILAVHSYNVKRLPLSEENNFNFFEFKKKIKFFFTEWAISFNPVALPVMNLVEA